MNLNNVVIRPILTEKSNAEREINKHTFLVHQDANKIQIKDALEIFYKVSVEAVRIVNVKRKIKTFNYRKGIKPGYKKAIVSLKTGSEFKFYEGV